MHPSQLSTVSSGNERVNFKNTVIPSTEFKNWTTGYKTVRMLAGVVPAVLPFCFDCPYFRVVVPGLVSRSYLMGSARRYSIVETPGWTKPVIFSCCQMSPRKKILSRNAL